jgi:hypothetical protein
VGVVCDEDDDGETAVGRGKTKAQQLPPVQEKAITLEKIDKAEIIALTTAINSLDSNSNKSFRDWIKKTFNAEQVQDIPKNCFDQCMVSINAKIKYLKDQERVVA